MIRLTGRAFVAGAAGTAGAVTAVALLSAGLVALTHKAVRRAILEALEEVRGAAGQKGAPTVTIDLARATEEAAGFGPKLSTRARRTNAKPATPDRTG